MLFRRVVQRHAKRNAQDATLVRAFVVLLRHLASPSDDGIARAARLSRPI
jgi:hypothetical protein